MPETTGAGAATPLGERGRARRWLAVALAAGLALRLAFGLGYWVDQPLTLDEQEYLLLANNVARGRGFSYESPASGVVEGRHVGRAPLYPLLLAGVGLAWPGSAIVADRLPDAVPAEVKVTQALCGCAIVWLIAWWARRVAGPRAGVVAALVAACYPPLVVIGAYALSESALCRARAPGGAAPRSRVRRAEPRASSRPRAGRRRRGRARRPDAAGDPAVPRPRRALAARSPSRVAGGRGDRRSRARRRALDCAGTTPCMRASCCRVRGRRDVLDGQQPAGPR